jgi:SAM-dependent methyltransferase
VATEPPIEDLLARLERERLDADRLYNDALTAVDRALRSVPALPPGPPGYDASRLEALNRSWNVLDSTPPPTEGGLRGWLRRVVWQLVGPPLEKQQQFNSALVEHLNRNAATHQASAAALTSLIDAAGREFAAVVRFESLLVQYLQQITVYVDSKDRSFGGPEIRQRLALTEQRLLALKQDADRRSIPTGMPAAATTAGPAAGASESPVDALTYVAFEDQFRGSRDEIRRRVEAYLPLLASATDVVDLGCGRGELLALLKEHGVRARGVDVNPAMVGLCRSRGLEAEQGDALTFLDRQDDASVGGLIAVQVVEHFAVPYLTRFLDAAARTLKPGAPIVLETINVNCWMAFFETYLRDPTHQQPLHPDTLKLLVESAGFRDVNVQFRSPVTDADRLQRIEAPAAEGAVAALAAALNDHADKLNRRLFSSMDYVVVGRK